ncbi:GH92 family glycosyl hydrolase [Streptomyces sp. HSG2]|uniref:GH92 family glycosyl hydrolase n=1 Tax=Streptomyces sp. HSG2 TaxID=2797167 RepID=UPI001906CD04|nr:GH92 family glycosyl hydrolase [Streptomyces sp. HSG2]
MRGRTRHGRGPAVSVAVLLALVVGTPGAAVALPRDPDPPERAFASSFEPDDPAPDWQDTVDTDADGRPASSGVDGGYRSGIPGSVADRIVEVRAGGENTGAGEVKENLVDGDPGTKWLTLEPTGWVEFELDAPLELTRYALTSANDHAERDPADWTLKGSTDGDTWTTLDGRSDETFATRFDTNVYELDRPATYRHLRLEITANRGGDFLQLADVQPATDDTPGPVPRDMLSRVDAGPTSSPTAKARAGFTGRHALSYAGRHTTEGPAWSANKIFDVDVRVERDTLLSYRVFPSMANGSPDYDATHVSVDLAFTDGTRLSTLGPTDQHGFALTPRGQGEAKVLYVDQWNHVTSRIGAVAAGRTVDRILVAYDSPTGPTQFRGWLDDVSLRPAPPEPPKAHLSDHVLTTRGTHSGPAYSRGNTFPATAVPHGFNFWTPVTDARSLSWLYQYARDNNADNLPTLQAFRAAHQPSPWMGDRQTFQVMPSAASDTPDTAPEARELAFRHENETARPYYYGVTFENGIRAELAPTDHAAMFRFTYPGDDASVIFDNVTDDAGLTLDRERGIVTGYSDVGSGLSTGATRLFVHGEFDQEPTGGVSEGATGHLRFETGPDRVVTLRLATSLIGVDQARENLRREIPRGTTLAEVSREARGQWERILGKVRVEGATPEQLTTLYSGLYRLYLYPNSGFEQVDGESRYASPFSERERPDTPTRTGAKIVDGEVYVNNGFWDTYRTTWPAYTLLTPSKAGELADGFVQHYRDGGWTSRWSSPGYADLMTGTSSDVAFADAYVKGVDFDAESAYEAALKNATAVPPSSGVGRKGMARSPFVGYTDTSTHEGLSWAMEGYLNDYGIARMGQALYERTGERRYREEAAYFLDRALGYVHLFDKEAGFFQGRDAAGHPRVPSDEYDPRVWGHDYTETNGWGYAFAAPQDSRGLANLYGGRSALAEKLDAYLATPETADPELAGSYGGVIHEMTEARDVRMGMYGHSNQVAHHALYMYDAAGQPWKTQARVREVLSRLYTGSEIGQGYHGDEDNGEQSAWFLFSALGFYPLVMGSGEYAIGSPLFTKATLTLENGRTLVVRAPRNSARNVYVQGVRIDGKRWESTSLPHSLLARGGVLEFDMGPRPSRWGTGEDAAPVSITTDDRVPTPTRDAVEGDGPLFDDTSATDTTVTTVNLPVTREVRALRYTLTSSDRSRAPTGWRLQGSSDGSTWRTLDARSEESFSWDRQTRVFSVRAPATYPKYRLALDSESALAEVELVASP